MIQWFLQNWIEIVGATLALIYLLLEVKQRWMMWVVGIISSLFYIYIFFHSKLYALAILNGVYVVMSVYGLYCWKLAKPGGENESVFRRVKFREISILSAIVLVLFGFISWILVVHTNSEVPYIDAMITTLSLIATWMAARKIVDHWVIWIFVNYFSVGLYLFTGLYPTAVLYVIYGSMSIVGWIGWKKTVIK